MAGPVPEFTLDLPVDKKSASEEAGASAAMESLRSGHPAGLVFLPVGYALGRAVGWKLGVSELELQASTQSIGAVSHDLHFDLQLAHAITRHIRENHAGRISELEENVPTEPTLAPGHLAREAGGRLAWSRSAPPPHPLAHGPIDTVIGVQVRFQGLSARSRANVRDSAGNSYVINPPLAVVLIAYVSVVHTSDWADLGGLTIYYESTVRKKYTEWADDGARPLREEIAAALQEIQLAVVPRLACASPVTIAPANSIAQIDRSL